MVSRRGLYQRGSGGGEGDWCRDGVHGTCAFDGWGLSRASRVNVGNRERVRIRIGARVGNRERVMIRVGVEYRVGDREKIRVSIKLGFGLGL